MFKIGQKVRIIKWVDIPEDIENVWGTLSANIGQIGIIDEINDVTEEGVTTCLYKLSGGSLDKFGQNVLEGEIEPVIKVGEQLVFDFIKEE